MFGISLRPPIHTSRWFSVLERIASVFGWRKVRERERGRGKVKVLSFKSEYSKERIIIVKNKQINFFDISEKNIDWSVMNKKFEKHIISVSLSWYYNTCATKVICYENLQLRILSKTFFILFLDIYFIEPSVVFFFPTLF